MSDEEMLHAHSTVCSIGSRYMAACLNSITGYGGSGCDCDEGRRVTLRHSSFYTAAALPLVHIK